MRTLSLFALALSLPAFGQVGNLQVSASALNFTALSGAALPQSQVIGVTSTGVSLPINLSVRYFTTTEGWLSATADRAATPGNVTVTVTPANLSPGNYTGQVLIVASGSQSALVTVTLAVSSTTAGGSVVTANPSTVSLTAVTGVTSQASVGINSVGNVPFQVFTNTTSGGNWLSVNTVLSTAPTTITIIANPTALSSGVYSGTVSIAPTNGSPGVSIPVSFTVGSGGGLTGFTVTPSTANFSYQIGTATPGGQAIYVNNSAGIVSYTASGSASWIRLTSNLNSSPLLTVNGNSNSNLNIYVDPTGLTAGNYGGLVTITASNGSTQSVAVSLTVSDNTILTASPASLTFNYFPDAGIPLAQQVTVLSTGASVNFTASASSTGWLLVGPQFGSTGGSNVLTVSVSPSGLPAGVYSGNINVTTGTTTIPIPVTINVGTSSVSSIAANPALLSFQTQLNSPSASQTLNLSSATGKNFLASASTTGAPWLQVTPNSGTTPASLTVSIVPQAVSAAGVYSGLIQVANVTDNTQLTIPVTMTVSGATLSASPQALSYSLTAGAPTPLSQVVQVSGSVNTPFTVTSDSAWLSTSPSSGTTPSGLTVFASAANLTPGNYTGVLTISGGGATTSVVVNASVSANASPTISPTALSFQFVTNGDVPPAQTISVNSTLGTANFTVSARTDSGSSWLIASASGISTPATISVRVQPLGLAPGTYRGVVTVTAFGTGESRSAEVILSVTTPAAPTLRTALHGATRELSAITPGMILSLIGTSMGPVTGVKGNVSGAGAFETSYNGYRVLFDGVPAPILYISGTQIDTVAPYAIAGRQSTRVEVEYNGARSNPSDLVVSPDAAPGIFTVDGSGRGQAAAINQSGRLNGPANPASVESVLVFYVTGEGQTEPVGQEGRVIATDLRKPVLPVAVNIGGVPVEVQYAGSTPGQVTGLMQVNVKLNSEVPRGPAVPIEIRVGPAPSPAGVTVAIQ